MSLLSAARSRQVRWASEQNRAEEGFANLAGQTVLVTGCHGGIGAAICQQLCRAGAFVIGSDMSDVSSPLSEQPHFVFVPCNLAQPASVSELLEIARALEATCLVNNAGVMYETSLADTDETVWQHTLEINLSSIYRLVRGLEPVLGRANSAAIVNVASQIAFRGGANLSAYSASKAGVIGLTRSLAHELGPHIRVNAVAPGPVVSPMTEAFMTEDWLAAKTRNLIANRFGQPDEVASVVRFLLSREAAYIYGQAISVNGGGYLS
ncbi:SDR family NAD(P)-dependent oxidoreductase [Halomonas dongshanensis]|uniref:SDR family oxidoreductase n=1 Tax=Halomonas dongshanensis TaxID=2890835 RepID=A0ABT2EAX4_9GAMM|nr:SDR family NAD(P)-dependent oxidoreductase [Halomonas dongshanensis]MCS2608731.1 SDR family oxidoreductase [Halomonas dongshanensis]